jgi:hypothetical protein
MIKATAVFSVVYQVWGSKNQAEFSPEGGVICWSILFWWSLVEIFKVLLFILCIHFKLSFSL